MRRRPVAPPAGGPVPFEAPVGDVATVWAAYEAWEAETTAHLAAHPGDAEAVERVRVVTVVPDAPFDPADL